jgi:hypothetical protein
MGRHESHTQETPTAYTVYNCRRVALLRPARPSFDLGRRYFAIRRRLLLATQFAPQANQAEQSETKQRNRRAAINKL